MYREFETMVGISVIPRTCTFSAILTVPLDIPKSLAVVAFINILLHHQPRERHEGSWSERAVQAGARCVRRQRRQPPRYGQPPCTRVVGRSTQSQLCRRAQWKCNFGSNIVVLLLYIT
jgi:hypothetical protein